MQQEANKKLLDAQRRYRDHHESQVRVPAFSDLGQWVYADRSLLGIKGTNRLVDDLYAKLFSRKPDPSCIHSCTTDTVTADEEGISNTISSDRHRSH